MAENGTQKEENERGIRFWMFSSSPKRGVSAAGLSTALRREQEEKKLKRGLKKRPVVMEKGLRRHSNRLLL